MLSPEHSPSACPKVLFVWDFDWTVVHCNSDEYVPAQFLDADALEEGFRKLLREGHDWHACVAAMVQKAMDETKATPEMIMSAARQMPYLSAVRTTLDDIHQNEAAGQMILSDGNTLFIGEFLDANGLAKHFSHGVVSNQGKWVASATETGWTRRLSVVHQSTQYGGHDCERCSANLCKAQALRNTILDILPEVNDVKERPKLVYVGDGSNDACPALKVLRAGDVLLARVGKKQKNVNTLKGLQEDEIMAANEEGGNEFGLMPTLHRLQDGANSDTLACKVFEWQSGEELKKLVHDILDDF